MPLFQEQNISHHIWEFHNCDMMIIYVDNDFQSIMHFGVNPTPNYFISNTPLLFRFFSEFLNLIEFQLVLKPAELHTDSLLKSVSRPHPTLVSTWSNEMLFYARYSSQRSASFDQVHRVLSRMCENNNETLSWIQKPRKWMYLQFRNITVHEKKSREAHGFRNDVSILSSNVQLYWMNLIWNQFLFFLSC